MVVLPSAAIVALPVLLFVSVPVICTLSATVPDVGPPDRWPRAQTTTAIIVIGGRGGWLLRTEGYLPSEIRVGAAGRATS